jgi:starvation-inducible outer membrane lipoprotein
MNRLLAIAGLLLGLTLGACAPFHVFPAQVMEGVDENFGFTAWRMVPNARVGQKVQLGGRIIQANPAQDGTLVVVMQLPQLPIVEQPTYGPKETGKCSGEFFVFYPASLDLKWLAPGNRLIVIGTTQQAHAVVVNDVQRSLPSLKAGCLHIWRTQGKEIAEFPYNTSGGYEPLEEETFCGRRHNDA